MKFINLTGEQMCLVYKDIEYKTTMKMIRKKYNLSHRILKKILDATANCKDEEEMQQVLDGINKIVKEKKYYKERDHAHHYRKYYDYYSSYANGSYIKKRNSNYESTNQIY